ncbi:MAG: hypothetical protein IOD12_14810 [Silvanigrellales bacterium]|nr:hypothetical protein [Silvanigrellales bacterium]
MRTTQISRRNAAILLIAATFYAFAFSCFSLEALAAKVEKPGVTIHLLSSAERGVSIRKPERTRISISNFRRDEARKFLLLALGPEVFDKSYGSGSSFFGAIPDDKCKVENTLLGKSLPFDEKSATFAAQTSLLHTCIVTRVINGSGDPLRIPPNQPGCKVEAMVSPTEALFSGGYCFVGVGIESLFYVNYELREECRSQAFLDLNGVTPRDFFAFGGYFIAGDASGQSLDLTPLDSVSLRYTQEPSSAALPLSADFGLSEPRYPVRVGVEIDMGGVRVVDLGSQGTLLSGSFHVINRCESICASGKCANPCEFPAAVGSILTVVDKTLGLPVHVVYTGAVAPAMWEGLLPFQTKVPAQLLVPGHTYALEADFQYLDQYYGIFKQGFSQFLVDVGDVDNLLQQSGHGTLPGLRPLASTASLPDMPLFPPLGGLLGGNQVNVGEALESLNRLVKFSGWPPYYEELCSGNSCVNIPKAQNKYKVSAEFSLSEFVDSEAKLDNLVLSRVSTVRGNARKAFDAPARVTCEQAPGPF